MLSKISQTICTVAPAPCKKDVNPTYLSPAFSLRNAEELDFLRMIDGTTGFSLFYIDIVKPLLLELEAKYLLEVGANKGEHTRLLLQYCGSYDANLIVIEPIVTPSLQEVVSASSRVRLFAEKSNRALARIDASVDIVLLEGDLNYYSVRSDLVAIQELSRRQNIPFPIVFFKNSSWPYARRDMYYDPDSIPTVERHEYTLSGMTHWSSQLEDGMINANFANAMHEGGPRNGVLTAVEDFLKESELSLHLFSLTLNHGLGIIYTENSRAEKFITTNLLPPPALGLFLETLELSRLNDIIHRLQLEQHSQHSGQGFRGRVVRVISRLGRKILGMIE